MNGNPLPPKKEVALALLERGSVHVHLDPRASGVVVPAWFKRQPQLVLQVGLNMPVPIPDLRVDEDGMSCTLSFNRSPFFCIVPWSSVYAMVGDDGRGMVWPEDVPPEVALQGRAQGEQAAKKPATERPLAVVKSAPEPTQKRAQKTARPSRAATAEPAGAAAKAKKPRAKKARPSVAEAPSAKATNGRNGQGVLIAMSPPMPSQPQAKPARREPGPAAVPSATTGPSARQDRVGAHDADAPKPAAAPAAAPRPSPRPGKASGGKPKREIPPYLRVVK